MKRKLLLITFCLLLLNCKNNDIEKFSLRDFSIDEDINILEKKIQNNKNRESLIQECLHITFLKEIKKENSDFKELEMANKLINDKDVYFKHLYNLLESNKTRYKSFKNYINLLEALDYFENQKDTTAIIYCSNIIYNQIILSNEDNDIRINKIKNNIIKYGEHSNYDLDKILLYHYKIINFIQQAQKNKVNTLDSIKLYSQKALKIAKRNKNYSFILSTFYSNLYIGYRLNGNIPKTNYLFLSYLNSKNKIDFYVNKLNLSKYYIEIKNLKEASRLINESIKELNRQDEVDLITLKTAYELKSELVKDRKSIEYYLVKDSITLLDNCILEKKLKDNIKYSLDKYNFKKESYEKEKIILRSKIYLRSLIVLIITTVIIFFLLIMILKIYRENLKLNRKIKNIFFQREMIFKVISHDLKSPIFVLKEITKDCKDKMSNQNFEQARENLTLISRYLSSLDFLTNNLLDWTWSNKANDNDIHIKQIIKNIFEELNYLSYSSNLNIEIINECKNEFFVKKPNALKTIIRNVITNIYKHSNNVKNIYIYLKVQNENLEIKITDDGQKLSIDIVNNILQIVNSSQKVNPSKYSNSFGLLIINKFLRYSNLILEIFYEDQKNVYIIKKK